MRRFFIIQALFWGVGLCLGAQNLSVSVDKPKVTSPDDNKYEAVEVSDMLHAVEGSNATYKITVTRADSIKEVKSLRYSYNGNDVSTDKFHLSNGKLTIEDIQIKLTENEDSLEFKIELTVIKTDADNTETSLTAEAPLKIKVWPVPEDPSLNFTPNNGNKPEKLFSGETPKLQVDGTKGGNKEGWRIEWKDGLGNLLTDDKVFEVQSNAEGKLDSTHIQLHVTNLAPDNQTKWYDRIYHYFVRFYPVPEVQFVGSYPENVVEEEKFTMEVKLADATLNKEDYTFDSYDWGDNHKSANYDFIASGGNETGAKKTVKVKCLLGLKDRKGEPKESNPLSHTFIVWPKASVTPTVSANNADDPILRFQDGELTITVNKKGGYRDGWRFLWKDENNNELSRGTEYTIQCDPSDEIVNKHVSLTVINQAEGRDEPWLTKSYDYYVSFYPTPIVKFDKIYPKNIQNDSTVTMTLVIQNADGTLSDDYEIECSWPNEGKNSKYVFKGDNESNDDGVKNNITVNFVATNKKNNSLKYENSLSYEITTWPNPVVNADGLTDYVGCGGQTKDFHVTSTGGRKDGWTYDWYKNGTIIGQGTSTFTLDLKNDDVDSEPIEDTDSVRVKNISDGDEWFSKVYLFSVTIYPKPRVPDTITLTDGNRGQEITKGIREGNDIGLYCDKCLGGYPDAWTYSWNCDNREIGAERQLDTNVLANYTGSGKANTDVTYSCYVQNLYKGSSWEEKRYDKTITVYRKPQTPTGLTRKGNGTSGTLIATTSVSDTDLEGHEYYLVFGYIDANGQMHDAMSQRQQNVGEVRWSTQISSSEMNSPSNTLYVYALWKYSDGAEITSGLRQLNSVDERWDGSSYDGSTRSVIANATAISNIEHGEDAITPHEYYMTNGMKSQGLSKGLNVIRMSDGTVKKMIVK